MEGTSVLLPILFISDGNCSDLYVLYVFVWSFANMLVEAGFSSEIRCICLSECHSSVKKE